MTILISILITFGVIVVLPLVISKRKTASSSTPQPPPTTTATTPPTMPASPKKLTAGWVLVWIAVIVLVAPIVIGLGGECLYHHQATTVSAQPINPPTWRDIQILRLSDKPITIPWPTGAPIKGTEFRTNLVREEEDKGRHFWVKSGNRRFDFDPEDELMRVKIIGGKPLRLSSKDGRPLTITFRWKY